MPLITDGVRSFTAFEVRLEIIRHAIAFLENR